MATRKIGPALAAGCTVILKPASDTPLTALALAARWRRRVCRPGWSTYCPAGAPARSCRRCCTTRGSASCPSPARPRSAGCCCSESSDQILNTSMELGGNAPFLVFADADLDAALDGAMVAKMRNAGEACTAANRLYVQALGRGGVQPPPGRTDGRAGRRPGHRRRAPRSGRWSTRTPWTRCDSLVTDGHRGRRAAADRRRERRTGPATTTNRPSWSTWRRTRPSSRGDLRPGRTDRHLRHRRRGGGTGQRDRVRPGFLRVHRRSGARSAGQRAAWSPAWSGSTAVWSVIRPLRSVGSNRAGVGREGGHEGVLDYTESKYIAVTW